ncbi:hypothetical protein DFQ26_004303 [Actinomortierella ambigua]|nr:hypothetical protein DFQ26_004303 [Actinomortierella ambigua]
MATKPPGTNANILISGAGIGGCIMAILLGRAGLDYLVLERATAFKRLGSSLTLSSQILRLFDQLGLLEELKERVALKVNGMTTLKQDLSLIGRTPTEYFEERYGYGTLGVARADFVEFLLSKIPSDRIQWGKRVLNVEQDDEQVTVYCADKTKYQADILIGAEGAYSPVRQSMFKYLTEKGTPPPKSDLAPLNFEMFCNVGVATNLDPKEYPVLNKENTELDAILANDLPFTVWLLKLSGNRIAWTAGGKLLSRKDKGGQETLRASEWELRTDEELSPEIRDFKVYSDKTLGDLIDKTDPELISRVMLEDKCFSTWYAGRMVLIGDACHKLMPFGGQGATQTVLDAACLASLLHELPSTDMASLNQAFSAYFKHRYPSAKAAYDSSQMATSLTANRGVMADAIRSISLKYMPDKVVTMLMDKLNGERPIVSFLPPPPDRGLLKPTSVPVSAFAHTKPTTC